MAKKAVAEPEDDLEDTEEEAEEEETEDDDEEAEEEDEEESEEDTEDAEAEGEDEEEAKPAKSKVIAGVVFIAKTGICKRVDILKVMGKNVKVRKPGDKTFPPVRVPITDCRGFDKATYEKLEENNAKITSWKDKNTALFQKLPSIVGRKGAVKRSNPLEEL